MNRRQVRGTLLQWRGAVKEWWAELTKNARLERSGQRDRKLGTIERRHGMIRAAIARQERHLAQHSR